MGDMAGFMAIVKKCVPFSEINCGPTIDMLYLREQLERGRLQLMRDEGTANNSIARSVHDSCLWEMGSYFPKKYYGFDSKTQAPGACMTVALWELDACLPK
jgi:hypothetical protein